MAQSPHQIAVRWFDEVWNQGRVEVVDELALPDAESFGFPQPESVLNREEFKASLQEFRGIFSDIKVSVNESVTEDNRIAVRWTTTMRHVGRGFGFPPTGKTVTIVGMTMFHLQDGRIARAWNALDMGTTIAYLSAIASRPEPYNG